MATVQQPLVRLAGLVALALVLVSGQAVRTLPDVVEDSRPEPGAGGMPDIALATRFAPDEPQVELPSLDGVETTTLYRVCRVTAYCDRGTTAAGVPSGVGQCAAPGYIPFGSTVYVPALDRTFVVTDRTHRRFRQSTVDIFIPQEAACREFGCNFLECEFTVPADTQ